MATITAATAANDAAAAYQRLRGHLAYLGLKAAADALPGLLDEARDGRLPLLDAPEPLMGTEADAAESRLPPPPLGRAAAAAAGGTRLRRQPAPTGVIHEPPPCGSSTGPRTCTRRPPKTGKTMLSVSWPEPPPK
jgi:hypothetical protein